MHTRSRRMWGALCALFAFGLLGVSQPAPSGRQILELATTTSTVDSGLLGVLHPPFEQAFNAQLKVIALGTGAALRSGENGDVDAVLVHARPSEDDFIRAGFGINRRNVMFNDFIVVGPAADPAGIRGLGSAAEAFARIAQTESTFISRGDHSGTHQKELAIWRQADVQPQGRWYLSIGSGMGETLVQSSQQGAYTLSDRGTYLALRQNLALEVLVEGPVKGGDPFLFNPYGVIAVNPARYPNRNYALAMAYIGYLTSPQAQQLIASFTVEGEALFFPDALSQGPNFEQYAPVSARDF